MSRKSVALAKGDGIGPEIMEAVVSILRACDAPIDFEEIAIGEKVYNEGFPSGISEDSWERLKASDAFLKAPITTPQGKGFKSLNVTVRGALGLYANVRPCRSFTPFVQSKHPGMDVVIIRENEEDLYAGIEYQVSPDSVHALKVISQGGCERIIRYAFEYARSQGRKKVTCFSKDNILKLSDGLFSATFTEIAKEYPDLESEHWIIDIGSAKLADKPEAFDVIVCANLYGDIISDIAAQIAGSVGLAGSANIGKKHAMFEAIHGSAPRRAGQDLANPSGLLMGAVMMLDHLGLCESSATIYNAWAKTVEAGIHTYDLYDEEHTTKKVGTSEFAKAVISHLGQAPQNLSQKSSEKNGISFSQSSDSVKNRQVALSETCDGVDLFITFPGKTEGENRAQELAELLKEQLSIFAEKGWSLDGIANRGTCLWPEHKPYALCSDHYRCRFGKKEASQSCVFKLSAFLSDSFSISQAHLLRKGGYTLLPHQQ